MSAQGLRAVFPFAPVAIVCGVTALTMRPAASLGALAVTLTVGAIGALSTMPRQEDWRLGSFLRFVVAVALGVAAFAAARWLHPPVALPPVAVFSVLASMLAAVAEELFFRKLVYGWLARWGVLIAVGGAAVAFAAVHVPSYGVAALPIDLAAGLLFGWQRWVTGGWQAPALTHVVANLLAMR